MYWQHVGVSTKRIEDQVDLQLEIARHMYAYLCAFCLHFLTAIFSNLNDHKFFKKYVIS